MIKVVVRDFQSIKHAEIEIDRFTVLTGTNNTGKSALVRAITGVFTNRSGHDFVRIGATHCSVEILFPDGNQVVWEKGKNVNRYIINGEVFSNVNRGAPPEVFEFGIEPVVISDKKYWPQFAPQFTGVHFLLDQSDSIIAEAVADVQQISKLNKSLKKCESDRRKTKSTLNVRKKDRTGVKKQLKAFKGLDKEISSLESLEGLQQRLQKDQVEIYSFLDLRERLQKATAEMERFRDWSVVQIPERVSLVTLKDTQREIRHLTKTSIRWKKISELFDKIRDFETDSFDLDFEHTVSRSRKRAKALQKVRFWKKEMQNQREALSLLSKKIESTSNKKAQVSEQLQQLLADKEICPLCESPVGK